MNNKTLKMQNTKLLLTLGFVLVICAGWLGLGAWYHAARYAPRDNLVKHRAILKGLSEAPSVLFLGDSHVAYGIRNSELPSEWRNLSYPGDKYGDILLKLEFLKSKNLLPRVLVLQMDPHKWAVTPGHLDGTRYLPLLPASLVGEIANWNLAEKAWNSLYVHWAVASPAFREELFRVWVRDAGAALRGQALPQLIQLDSLNDWQTSEDGKWAVLGTRERMLAASQKVELHFGNGGLDTVNVRYLRQIIAFCAANEIKIIGIQMPVTPLYREGRQAKMSGFPLDPVSFPVLNFTDSLSTQENCFSDPNHLNVRGSRAFTSLLVRELQRVAPQ
jgi:hypothetical protein